LEEQKTRENKTVGKKRNAIALRGGKIQRPDLWSGIGFKSSL
jgi:hypothetical protein